MLHDALFSRDTVDQHSAMPRPSGSEVAANNSSRVTTTLASATPTNISLPLAQSQPPLNKPGDYSDVEERLVMEASPDMPPLLPSNEPTTLRRRTARSTTAR